jgi:hypothetical protein
MGSVYLFFLLSRLISSLSFVHTIVMFSNTFLTAQNCITGLKLQRPPKGTPSRQNTRFEPST